MNNSANYGFSFLTGAVITVMAFCNSALATATNTYASIMTNQVVGLTCLSVIMLAGRGNKVINPPREHANPVFYFSGLYGLIIMGINCLTIPKIGTALSMACCVLGQSVTSLVFDLTGFLGLTRRKLSLPKVLGLLVSLAGIIVMGFAGETFPLGYVLAGIFAGALTSTQMCLNSRFARMKGPFYSARQNMITGLAGITVAAFIFDFKGTVSSFSNIVTVPWYFIIGGGVLAIIVVISANVIIPRIPVIFQALLMSSGQLLMSVLMNRIIDGYLDTQVLTGSLLVLVGIISSILGDHKSNSRK